MPGQQAEILLNVEDANIFVVSGYEGDENLSYICVQVHSANLFHCGEYKTSFMYRRFHLYVKVPATSSKNKIEAVI